MPSSQRIDVKLCGVPRLTGRVGLENRWHRSPGALVRDYRNGVVYSLTVDVDSDPITLTSLHRQAFTDSLDGALLLPDSVLVSLVAGAHAMALPVVNPIDPELRKTGLLATVCRYELGGEEATPSYKRPALTEVAKQVSIATRSGVSIRSHFKRIYDVSPASIERWVSQARAALGEEAVPIQKPGRRPDKRTPRAPISVPDDAEQQRLRDKHHKRARSTSTPGEGTR